MLKQTCARPLVELIVPTPVTEALKQVGLDPVPGMEPPAPLNVCDITEFAKKKKNEASNKILITPMCLK